MSGDREFRPEGVLLSLEADVKNAWSLAAISFQSAMELLLVTVADFLLMVNR